LLACSTASFPADEPLRALLKIAWAGYSAAEFALAGGALPDEGALTARLREEGLELAALEAGMLPAGDTEELFQGLACVGRACALARSADCSRVIVAAPQSGTLEELQTALERLDLALGGLAVELCLVNRSESLLAEPAAFRELWGRGLPPRLRPALDPAQAVRSGWDPVELDLLPVLPTHLYLTDLREGREASAGEGTVGLPRLLAELRDRNFRGTVALRLQGAGLWEVEPRVQELREWFEYWWSA